MPRSSVERWEQEHKKHLDKFLGEVDALYKASTDEMVRIGMLYSYDPKKGETFSYSSSKTRKKQAEKRLKELHDNLVRIIQTGITSEWAFANEKTDSWVRSLFSDPKRGYMLHNLEALEAFQNRKIYGHTLSARVWDYTKQFKEQIELSLSVGISEGRSAAQISRDVRHHLQEPDKLFRRVRDKFGNLALSKNAQAYHPGQGVYRSSYQNAMRMARTEINGAYRQADYERWQQLDFIVGIEIKTSKSHAEWLEEVWYPQFKSGPAPEEICDTMEGFYPKDFKFIGWHPNCKCYAVPVFADNDEHPTNIVKDVPPKFKEWLSKNADRIETANRRGTLPYWISENTKYSKISVSPLNSPEKGQIIASAREAFDTYGADWKKAYFDERSGGYYVVHEDHQFAIKGGGGDAELTVAKALAQYNGKQVEMLPENQGTPAPDIKFDNRTWDIKAINKANVETIRKYIKNARKADCAIFYWEKDNMKLESLHAAVDKEVARLSSLNRTDEMPDVYYMKNGLLKVMWKK